MRRTIGALASTLALVAALSACGGDPEPQFEAEPSGEPTTSSPPASAEPELWEERTPEGAVAFAEHWLGLFREAENTGDTVPLREASASACESCTRFAVEIDAIYGAGGAIQSDGWRLVSAGEPAQTGQMSFSVPFDVQQSDQRIRESSESEWKLNRGIKIGLAAEIVWRQGKWQMARLDLVQ